MGTTPVLPVPVTVATAPKPNRCNTPLPGGRGEMAVSLAGQTAGRYQVTVRFTRNTTSTIQFVAALGEPFFTVRASRPDTALVLGFIVR